MRALLLLLCSIGLLSSQSTAADNEIKSKHLTVKLSQSAESVRPGARVELLATVTLQPNLHVYAPGIEPPYKPIALTVERDPKFRFAPLKYPPSKKLHLAAIDETVPAYEGTFTIVQPASVSANASGQVEIKGRLDYQTCDDKICYLPVSLPLSWTLAVVPSGRK
jgi:hypothetical protein